MSFEVLPIDSDDDDQIEMLQVERKDEDPAKMMRSKPRHPKCREKWSLLWFIPSTVLNDRVVNKVTFIGMATGLTENSHHISKANASFDSSIRSSLDLWLLRRFDDNWGSSPVVVINCFLYFLVCEWLLLKEK